ncbi:rod-binding protein [Asticcacaulis sp. AND118]|uniref:rod-binding protein n=1 Tax=Asticcacaulis sp. AND118 TaxID=2840468 RepID=UPI001CFFEEB9|nr:rod-binding protein [Asticcacaulis sp. AND118]UDF02578.1 rod-binding protein [Asticcacaulis sp. AND118]
MDTLSKPAVSLNLDAASINRATKGDPKKIGDEFEHMVMSQMLKPMFEGLETDGMFGGGEGEEAFRSFYLDALAGQVVKSGGIGISDQVQKQLLALQEAQA